jgi:hypothetical protein
LGYTEGATSGSGGIDSISCTGGTGSAQAFAVAYNALYQRYLPGAFNVMVFESDGLPNTLTLNMWDSANTVSAFASNGSVSTPTGCRDANGLRKVNGGWNNNAAVRNWTTGYAMNTITTNTPHVGFIPDIPSGAIASIYSTDPPTPPSTTKNFTLMNAYVDPDGNDGLNQFTHSGTTSGCLWDESGATTSNSMLNDFAWLPLTDVYGNSLKPASGAYIPSVVTTTIGGASRLRFESSDSLSTKWQNFHDGALNATDNAAYRARTNANIPATVFVIGLGAKVDHTLLQRMANDARGDASAPYPACAANPSCIHYDNQPKGTYIYSSDSSVLKQKFLELSSQILRLSQ